MLPSLYLILIKKNGPPYPEVTVVNLPSSLMIVNSNAFVFYTSLLVLVSRYGLYCYHKKWFLVFPDFTWPIENFFFSWALTLTIVPLKLLIAVTRSWILLLSSHLIRFLWKTYYTSFSRTTFTLWSLLCIQDLLIV